MPFPTVTRRVPYLVLAAVLVMLMAMLAIGRSSVHAQAASQDGTYVTTINGVNDGANGGSVTGTVSAVVSGDTITVSVNASGLQPNTAHAMHFHTGNACPAASADANHDGVIDVVEGLPAYGPILVPIDSDLANTTPGQGSFPASDAQGNLHFTTTASLSALVTSLHAAADPKFPAFAKLTGDEAIDLAMRTFVIHGVSASTSLPSTAASIAGEPAQATLPVGCGVMSKVAASPEHGAWQTTIGALNSTANGNAVSGTVVAVVDNGILTVAVNASGLQPNTAHAMHFHTLNACPAASADANQDGVIDVVEGLPAYGPILVPIDTDLANTSPGAGAFPMSDANGDLHFTASATMSDLLASLQQPADPKLPAFAKLTAGQALDLAMRTFVIHGVSAGTTLPSSAASIAGEPAQATLPVGCGAMSQVGSPAQSATVTITLQGRFTLVGWLGKDGISVSDALANAQLTSKVAVVWGWDASTQSWKGYFPGVSSPGSNDLSVLNTGQGYWVALLDPSTPAQWDVTAG